MVLKYLPSREISLHFNVLYIFGHSLRMLNCRNSIFESSLFLIAYTQGPFTWRTKQENVLIDTIQSSFLCLFDKVAITKISVSPTTGQSLNSNADIENQLVIWQHAVGKLWPEQFWNLIVVAMHWLTMSKFILIRRLTVPISDKMNFVSRPFRW